MPWRGAEYDGEFPSLGWALLDWIEQYLVVPNGPDYRKPLCLTDRQARTLIRFYRLDPDTGRRIYRRASIEEAKGVGKSPFVAALALAELAGPVQFAGWSADGDPVGRPHPTPWVQVAAASEDQAGNTYSHVFEMVREGPAADELGLDVGMTRIHRVGRSGRLEPVTAAAGSREGQPVTFAVLDETHLWTRQNGGRRLASTIRRNTAKMGGSSFETTNAYVVGEGSVAEATALAAEQNEPGLLHEAHRAPWVEDLANTEELRAALAVAYEGCPWIDLDRLVAEVQDPATDPDDGRRFYLNQPVKADHAAVDPKVWASRTDATVTVADNDVIGIGFDGSISGDATSLVGCTESGHLFHIRTWERPLGAKDWTVPRGEVHAEIEHAFTRWRVGLMLCDPPLWRTEIEEWQERWGDRVLAFDTNQSSRMAPACDRFGTSLASGWLSHDGDELLTRHTLAMARKKVRIRDADDDGRTRYVFTKSDTRKIDAGVAAVLAVEAAQTMPEIEPAPQFFASWR